MENEQVFSEQLSILYQADEPVEYHAYTWPARRGCQVVDVVAVEAPAPVQAIRRESGPEARVVGGVVRHRYHAVWVN